MDAFKQVGGKLDIARNLRRVSPWLINFKTFVNSYTTDEIAYPDFDPTHAHQQIETISNAKLAFKVKQKKNLVINGPHDS